MTHRLNLITTVFARRWTAVPPAFMHALLAQGPGGEDAFSVSLPLAALPPPRPKEEGGPVTRTKAAFCVCLLFSGTLDETSPRRA